MSHYYDIACVDCGSQAGCDNTNHRSDTLQYVVDNKYIFAGCDDLRVDFINIDSLWLREHKDHRLVVKSEYETLAEIQKRLTVKCER